MSGRQWSCREMWSGETDKAAAVEPEPASQKTARASRVRARLSESIQGSNVHATGRAEGSLDHEQLRSRAFRPRRVRRYDRIHKPAGGPPRAFRKTSSRWCRRSPNNWPLLQITRTNAPGRIPRPLVEQAGGKMLTSGGKFVIARRTGARDVLVSRAAKIANTSPTEPGNGCPAARTPESNRWAATQQ